MNWTAVRWVGWILLCVAIWPLNLGRFILALTGAIVFMAGALNEKE